MWNIDRDNHARRIEAMEHKVEELTRQLDAIPARIEGAIRSALEAHESRDTERARAMAEQIGSSLMERFLGEDLVTGADAARNKRALQQILRQGVMVWPIFVRMQTRLLWFFSTAVVGLLLVSFIGAGTIIEIVRLKLRLWFGS